MKHQKEPNEAAKSRSAPDANVTAGSIDQENIEPRAANAGLRNRILLYLWKHEAESVSAIARALDVLRPSVSRAIGELQKADLIEKQGRACALTALGGAEAQKLEEALPRKAQKASRSVRSAVQQVRETQKSATRLLSSALLIDATDLDGWAQRLDARSQLPRVVRRLILSTARDLEELRFPAGEGVQTGGWDGLVVSHASNAFVPTGTSVWEMGTDKDIKGKADEDYKKRTQDPLELDPAKTTFVFVTPRRWSQKEKWVKARRAEGKWGKVQVYDADDLETWLVEAPAVHLWLSLLLGKYPRGARALGDFWVDWAAKTSPPFMPDLVIGGRTSAHALIKEWLLSKKASSYALRGDTRDEPIAFLASVIAQMEEPLREWFFSRAVVTEEVSSWNELIASSASLLLIPRFDGSVEGTSRAVNNGHQVFLSAEPHVMSVAALPRIVRDEAEKALEKMGLARERASDLATLARRSLWALRRKLASEPTLQTPLWAQPQHVRELMAACLVGAWQADSPADREVLERLAGSSYNIIQEALVRWSKGNEPPVRLVGGIWMIVAPEDAWRLLTPFFTKDDLTRFQAVVRDVLNAPPSETSARVERLGADLSAEPPRVSSTLREGIASTLALMAALSSEVTFMGDIDGAAIAGNVVRSLLGRAKRDLTAWSSFAPFLPLLAEAAPGPFLDAVDEGLSDEAPGLAQMFQTKDDNYGFGPTSPHNYLLWALETLAWNPDFLSRAALALARLVQLDPGAKNDNHPFDSLREIFVVWYPNTTVSLSSRMTILGRITKRTPDVAWRLFLRLLPTHYGDTCGSPHSPKWHDWKPDEPRPVFNTEIAQTAEFLVEQFLLHVGPNVSRWCDLIARAGDLWPQHREKLIYALETFDFSFLSCEEAVQIVGALRDLVTRHEECSDAGWAMPEADRTRFEAVARNLEPHDLAIRHRWLFERFVHLPERRERGWQEHEEKVAQLRREALSEITAAQGMDGVFYLASQAPDPESVGITLGQMAMVSVDVDAFLAQNLASSELWRAALATGWVRVKAWRGDEAWLQTRIQAAQGVWTPEQWGEFFLPFPFSVRLLGQLAGLQEEAQRYYWTRTQNLLLPDEVEHAERVINRLLGVGRIAEVIKIIRWAISKDKRRRSDASAPETSEVVPPERIMDVLETALTYASAQHLNALVYETGALLDHLEDCGASRDRLARLEWLFFPLHEHTRVPKVLHEELGNNPTFFVELLCLIYRAQPGETETDERDDSQGEAASQEPEDAGQAEFKAALGRRAWSLLFNWHRIPGLQKDGTLDEAHLKEWVARARELGQENKRSVITLIQVGHALAHSPRDEDGAWPHRAVRDIIDDITNPRLESGFFCQVFNNRGVTSRGLTDGGAQERDLAAAYEKDAVQIADSWPRTASVLRGIAQDYKRHAEREDLSADLTQDFWR